MAKHCVQDHSPDLSRIPETLRALNWSEMDESIDWYDGQTILAAVPVQTTNDREIARWSYEFSVLTISYDEDRLSAEVDGELWGWELSDADFYVRID